MYILLPLLCRHKADFRCIEAGSRRGVVDTALAQESGNYGSTPAWITNFGTFKNLFLNLKLFLKFNFLG